MEDKNILDNLSGQEIKEMINVEKLNLEKLDASALRKLIDYETDMLCLGEGDMELIAKCSEMLDVLDPNPMSTEEFMDIIKKSKEEHVTIIDGDTSRKDVPNRRFVFKRIVAIVAATLILMTTAVGAAGAFGINIIEEINKIIRQKDGTTTEVEGFTFHKGGEITYYTSIEDIAKEQNWSIMYPTKLPENVKIDKIGLGKSSRGNDKICIITNDETTMINIEKNASYEDIWKERDSFYEVDGVEYYIFQRNGVYLATCYHNGDCYSIQTYSYDGLILIIDNLKE